MPKQLILINEVNTIDGAKSAIHGMFGQSCEDLAENTPNRLRMLAKLLRWIADAKDEMVKPVDAG